MNDFKQTKCTCGAEWLHRDEVIAPTTETVPATLQKLGLVRVPPDAADDVKAIVDRLSTLFGYLSEMERERLTGEVVKAFETFRALREAIAASAGDVVVQSEAPPAPEVPDMRSVLRYDVLVRDDAKPSTPPQPIVADVLTPTETFLRQHPELYGDTRNVRDVIRYDCLVNGSPTWTIHNRTCLFGNTNIGSLKMTNMQAPGTLARDERATIVGLGLDVVMSREGVVDQPFTERVRRAIRWQLDVADHCEREGWGDDLKRPISIVPVVLPQSQYFNVILEFFDRETLAALNEYKGDRFIRFNLHLIEERDCI